MIKNVVFRDSQGDFLQKVPLGGVWGRAPLQQPDSRLQPKASGRCVRRPFDTLGANHEKQNNKSQTLFFGIPKGTFYKKSPLAGFGAKAPCIWD